MNKPTVSVVMITYGHEHYVKQAIEGVLIQKCDFDIELIIANDCSPDNTDFIVREIIKKTPKSSWIQYNNHDQNIGMMANFIWGLQQANGKYIALCEGDDYWTDPYKLQKQVDFLEGNLDVVICGTNYNEMVDDKLRIKNKFSSIKIFNHYSVFHENQIGTLTSLFRNDFVVPEYFRKCNFGDMILLLELTKLKGKIAVLPFNSAVYRIHNGGVFSSNSWVINLEKALNDIVTFIENNPKNFRYILISLGEYSRKAIVQLIRALLCRPHSDFRFFTIYTKTVLQIIARYTRLKS